MSIAAILPRIMFACVNMLVCCSHCQVREYETRTIDLNKGKNSSN